MTRDEGIPEEAGDWVEGYARAGYVVKGIVYVLVGWLAFQTALGVGGRTTGTSGVLFTIVRQPLGQVLLLLTGLGLFGYALWRLVQAVLDVEEKGTDPKGLLKRFGYLVSGLAYGSLGFEALRQVFGIAASGGEDPTETWTGRVLEAPFGGWLVGAGAAVMFALAVNAGVVAFGRLYRRKLALARMSPFERIVADVTAIAGLVGRGAIFALIGVLLARAAYRHDAQAAGSSEDALELLASWPKGPWLLGAVALGLVAYGAFAAIQARYRRMDVDVDDV